MPLSLFVTSNLIYKKKKNTTGFLKKLLSITILMRKRLKEIKRLIVKLNKGKKNLRFFFYKFNNKADRKSVV